MMTRKIGIAVAAGLAAVGSTTFGLAVSGVAGASTPPAGVTATSTSSATHSTAWLKSHHRRLIRDVVVISADALHMQPSALRAELRTGKSIADVANSRGIDPQTIVNALVTRGDAKIDALLSNGKITATQAAQLKAQMPTLSAKVVAHQFGQHAPTTGATAG